MSSPADAQLLFGWISLRNGLIDEARLVDAFRAWTLDRSKGLADRLVESGLLDEAGRSTVEALARAQAEAHAGAETSPGATTIERSTRGLLASPAGGDTASTLSNTGPGPADPDATRVQAGHADAGAGRPADGHRFRLLRPHAKGGLGVVYVALDSELNREVALKQILEKHADDPASRGRFLVEAEITGGLEHPGIVPVYGLGIDGDGRPYYAMRFIRGESLREAIDAFHRGGKSGAERSLAFRQLLRKFTDVCNAIEYAHSRGVLHRDIKPSNVIVGKHGETLVVDWGLAKALGESPADGAEGALLPSSSDGSSETLPGQALGTPAYMGPEQARGELEGLGPRSDVYSLGATLYCLVTGEAPFQGAPVVVLKAVERGDFRRPRERDASIDPALEAIVLKAMARDPADRYASARALAEDVDRWLADERVGAYREPWTRGLNRWLTRNRTAVTGVAAAGLVALVGLGIVSAVQTRAKRALDVANGQLKESNGELTAANAELEIQRARAEEREGQAIDAVKRFKDAVSDNPELKNEPALKPLRTALLREPLAFFGRLREGLQADADTRPESLARLAGVIHDYAHLADEIGEAGDALKAHDDGLAIWERLARDRPDFAEYRDELARIENCRGNLLKPLGRVDEALAAYMRAIALLERLADAQPAVPRHRLLLAAGHNNVGTLYRATGRIGDAEAAYRRAIDAFDRLLEDHPDHAETRAGLASGLYNLGILLRTTGRPDEALASFRRSLELRERLAEDEPAVARHRADLAAVHNSLGVLLRALKRPDEALGSYLRSIDIQERLARDNPSATQVQANLATNLGNLGNLYSSSGRVDEAEAAYRRSIEIAERLAREHPEVPDHPAILAGAWENFALTDLDASRFAEAAEKLREAIAWQRKALAANPGHPQYRPALEKQLARLARAERLRGREDEAVAAERDLEDLRLDDPRARALDARLEALGRGEAARDDGERLAMARRAADTRRFALAVGLWAQALEADPKAADDRDALHRFNAARAAASAADGRGIDPPGDEADRARLRGRARDWLAAERAAWAGMLEAAQPRVRNAIAATLRRWQTDPDLAPVRDPESLAKLPDAERRAWSELWESVRALLERASSP
ncbi:MAG: serine/threonine-protein kinase [Isosphaeraceae bacterium]